MGDANTIWDADAVRRIVRPYADPAVGMVTGRVELVNPSDGTNQEGVYWRYEMWLRTNESLVHSETASNGAIHSIRRSLYKELEPADDHDISFPYHVVQQGSRAVYEPTRPLRREHDDGHRRRVRAQVAVPRALLAGDLPRLDVEADDVPADLRRRDRLATASCAT